MMQNQSAKGLTSQMHPISVTKGHFLTALRHLRKILPRFTRYDELIYIIVEKWTSGFLRIHQLWHGQRATLTDSEKNQTKEELSMRPETTGKIKFGIWGLICGTVIAMIVGFANGGWLTEGAAQEISDEMVLASRAVISVAKFVKETNHEEKIKELWALDSSKKMKTILFVCRGNMQRSVVAEMVCRKIISEQNLQHLYDVMSRGIMGTPASPVLPSHNNLKFYNKDNSKDMEWEHSLPTLQELGIAEELQKHNATVVTKDDLERASLVVAMDTDVMSHPIWGLNTQFPMYRNKIMLFTELVGSRAGLADAAGAKDTSRHRQLILEINQILRQGFNSLLKRIETTTSQTHERTLAFSISTHHCTAS